MSITYAYQEEKHNSDIHQMVYRWDVRKGRFVVASSFDQEKTRQWHERLAPWALPPGRGQPSPAGPDNPHEATYLRFDDTAVLCFRSFGDQHASESVTYVLVASAQAVNAWHALAVLQLRWLANPRLPVHLWPDRAVGPRSAGELLPDTTSARTKPVLKFVDERDKDDVVVLLATLLGAPDDGASFVVVADSARRLDLLTALLHAAEHLKIIEEQTFTTLSVTPPDDAPRPRWIFLRPDQLDAGKPPGHPPLVREWKPEPFYRRRAKELLGRLAPPKPGTAATDPAPGPAGARDETPPDVMVVHTERTRNWAEWIAWGLEEARYQVFLAEWDVLAGDIRALRLDDASSRARHIFVVLSDDIYDDASALTLISTPGEHNDTERKVVPVEVNEAARRGYLNRYLSIDIKTMDESQALQTLLRETFILFSGTRRRPPAPPAFPRPGADVPPGRPAALRVYLLPRGAPAPEPRMPPYPTRQRTAALPLSAGARAAAHARAEQQADDALTAAIHDTFAAFSEHVSAVLGRAGASLAEAETYDDVRCVLVEAVGDAMCLRGDDLAALRRLVGLHEGPAGPADGDPRPDQRSAIAARARAAAREPHPGHALAVTLAVDRFVERVLAAASPEITRLAAQAASRTVDQTVAAVEDLITQTAHSLTHGIDDLDALGDLGDPVESSWKAGLPAAGGVLGQLTGLVSAARTRLGRIRMTRSGPLPDEASAVDPPNPSTALSGIGPPPVLPPGNRPNKAAYRPPMPGPLEAAKVVMYFQGAAFLLCGILLMVVCIILAILFPSGDTPSQSHGALLDLVYLLAKLILASIISSVLIVVLLLAVQAILISMVLLMCAALMQRGYRWTWIMAIAAEAAVFAGGVTVSSSGAVGASIGILTGMAPAAAAIAMMMRRESREWYTQLHKANLPGVEPGRARTPPKPGGRSGSHRRRGNASGIARRLRTRVK